MESISLTKFLDMYSEIYEALDKSYDKPQELPTCVDFIYKKNNNNKLEPICDSCGKHHALHISSTYCENFIDNNFGYCKLCNKHISNHMYTEKFFYLPLDVKVNLELYVIQMMLYSEFAVLYKNLCIDILKQVYIDNYRELLLLRNKKAYHDIIN